MGFFMGTVAVLIVVGLSEDRICRRLERIEKAIKMIGLGG